MWLQIVIGAYRSAPQSSTGFSPAQLVYGRSLRLPSDVLGHEPAQHPHDPQGYLEQLIAKQRLAREVVDAEIAAAQDRQTRNYNDLTEPPGFKKDDLVYKLNPAIGAGQSRKIRNRFTGPYRVIEARGDANYVIQHPQGGRRQCVHRNRLKHCYRRQLHKSTDSGETTATTEGTQLGDEGNHRPLVTNTGAGPLSAFEIEEIDCEPGRTDTDPDRHNPAAEEATDGEVMDQLATRRRPVRRPAWLKDFETNLPDPERGTHCEGGVV